MPGSERYFRKGLGLREEVKPVVKSVYGSALVDLLQQGGHELHAGRLHIRLARSFGFCYGVDRAVEYAYETRRAFPSERIFLLGEIVHNPHVNARFSDLGFDFVFPSEDGFYDLSRVAPQDVVIVPAFGITQEVFEDLREVGCVVVDTTCGSVLNVWKRVVSYARDGFTTIIHGKPWHEETRATRSWIREYPGAESLAVLSMEQVERVCEHIRKGGDREAFLREFEAECSPGFDPDVHLRRIGVANQTTMLASESMEMAARLAAAMADRWGPEEMQDRFRSFDTICTATQVRQDAVREMMESPPELMIVVGGYNSSNTGHLARICDQSTTTYHIEDARCVDLTDGTLTYRRINGEFAVARNWLPDGDVEIGITAGASSPNVRVGETVERILQLAGVQTSMLFEKAAVSA